MVKTKPFLIVILLVLFDQLTKFFVFANNFSLDLKIFAFTVVQNTGAVWGLFKDSNMLFIWVSIIAIGVVLYIHDKIPEKAFYFYLLVFAGIIGNLIDRMFRGFVVDFIDFKVWPVFNLADSFIVIGVIGLVILMWKED